MTILQAFVLGIIQGITEFLPISSSAHLVLAPFLFGWRIPPEHVFPFDVLVQLGTLLAVFAYFWKDLYSILRCFFIALGHRRPFENPQARLGWYLLLSAIPAGVIGLLLKDQVEKAFNSPVVTAGFLFVTAALLVIAERLGRRERSLGQLGWVDALWIGAAQALSIFPGISRSGATITAGMTRNFQRTDAGRFSFLMSIPVMLGAGLVSLRDLAHAPNLVSFLPVLLVGFVTAAVVGYFAIGWLLSFLSRKPMLPFAVYCTALALLILIVTYAFP